MNYKNVFKTGLLMFSMALVFSCSKEEDPQEPQQTYNTEVAVTDAPIDQANVEGAFVTITNVKINGKAVEGFEKTTVNLLALQNGTIEALGNVQLESGVTSNITIELDNETDAQGNAPGSYIALANGEKRALLTSSKEIVLNSAAEVKENNENRIVLDFDLRKLIVLEGEANDSFAFVADSEFSNSVRAVNEADAGTIKGNVDDSGNVSEKIVVFAYQKGTYSEEEANPNANVRFQNAVNSSVVTEADGSYELHFLEEGDYELHFASYAENAEGKAEFQGMLDVDTALGLDLSLAGFGLTANNTLQMNVVVKGMLTQ